MFSLFESYKPGQKVQLKNPNKVVIGSGTDLERAFQIGNFMNMLHNNMENENQSMTNSLSTVTLSKSYQNKWKVRIISIKQLL